MKKMRKFLSTNWEDSSDSGDVKVSIEHKTELNSELLNCVFCSDIHLQIKSRHCGIVSCDELNMAFSASKVLRPVSLNFQYSNSHESVLDDGERKPWTEINLRSTHCHRSFDWNFPDSISCHVWKKHVLRSWDIFERFFDTTTREVKLLWTSSDDLYVNVRFGRKSFTSLATL